MKRKNLDYRVKEMSYKNWQRYWCAPQGVLGTRRGGTAVFGTEDATQHQAPTSVKGTMFLWSFAGSLGEKEGEHSGVGDRGRYTAPGPKIGDTQSRDQSHVKGAKFLWSFEGKLFKFLRSFFWEEF